jgi:mannosyltransferase
VPRFNATTVLLRPVQTPSKDLWDDLLREASRVEHHTTQTLVRGAAPWLVPAIVTGLVTAIGLGRSGLWTDELATWGMATTPWPEFWPVLRYVDAVLAPYYVLMHGWVQVFGDSDIALRMPSLLAMVGSAGFVGAIGNRVVGRNAGLLAGIVFALLPSTSRFAAEARPYALTVLVACVATWLLVGAWEKSTVVRWLAYGVAVAVLGWLNIVAVLLVAAHAWAVGAWKRDAWWRFALAAGSGVATCLPLLVYGTRQRNQVAYIPPLSFSSFISYSDVLFGGIAVAVLLIVLALFSLPLRFPSAVFAAWAAVPTVALVVVSVVLPMFLPRYLLYTTPGWALLAGVTLARLRPLWAVAPTVVIAALVVQPHLQMRTPGGHEQATAQLATVLEDQAQSGDAIVYADDEPVGSWTGRDTVAHYVSEASRPRDVLATHPQRTAGLLLAKECADVAACLNDTPRLWVVRIGNLSNPLAGIGATKEEVLTENYRIRQVWYPTGLTLALLEKRSAY